MEKMPPNLEEKLSNMYKDNPLLFMKKTIDTLSEMNLEYQLELYTLLSIVIRYITATDDISEETKEQFKLVADRILTNHSIESIHDLKTAVKNVHDTLKARRLNDMPVVNDSVN